eukprot:symbB.v1.2.040903.t1/scaffold7636.1/size10128/3
MGTNRFQKLYKSLTKDDSMVNNLSGSSVSWCAKESVVDSMSICSFAGFAGLGTPRCSFQKTLMRLLLVLETEGQMM